MSLSVETTYKPEGATVVAQNGDVISMHYTGTLPEYEGKKFDSSVDRGKVFKFTLGVGQVIQGWDQGIPGMVKGEKRILTIPASMGYGAKGYPPIIPGGATLRFEIELIDVQKGK